MSRREHLTYLIDGKLREDLRRFYGPTRDNLNMKARACTNHYPDLVKSDLNERLEGKATPTTATEVYEVSKAGGWNLQRGFIREEEMPSYSQYYGKLRAFSHSFTHETLAAYFDWWREKTLGDKPIVDHSQARDQALRDAESLRDRLAEKLGAGLGVMSREPGGVIIAVPRRSTVFCSIRSSSFWPLSLLRLSSCPLRFGPRSTHLCLYPPRFSESFSPASGRPGSMPPSTTSQSPRSGWPALSLPCSFRRRLTYLS